MDIPLNPVLMPLAERLQLDLVRLAKAVHAALTAGDVMAARESLHALRGLALNFGLDGVVREALELGERAKEAPSLATSRSDALLRLVETVRFIPAET